MTLNTTAESETAKIARGLREKDMQLLADLVERCQHRLVRYLLYLTGRQEYAEDLAQETWIRDRSTGDPDFFPVGLSLDLAVLAASLFKVEKHSAHTADARRFPISEASRLTSAQSEKN